MRIVVDDKNHTAGDLDPFGALTYRELLDALNRLPEECLDFPVRVNVQGSFGVKDQVYELPHFGPLSSIIVDEWLDADKNSHYDGVEVLTGVREA